MLERGATSCLFSVTLGSIEWHHRNDSEVDAKILTAKDPSVITDGGDHLNVDISEYFDVGCYTTNLHHVAGLNATTS